MLKNKRLSIRMNENAIEEIKNVAKNNGLSVHDLIFYRCITPTDRKLNMDIEYLRHTRK